MSEQNLLVRFIVNLWRNKARGGALRLLPLSLCFLVATFTFASADESLDFAWISSVYGGVGISTVHHTGYGPGAGISAEEWVDPVGKAFLGADVNQFISGEIVYYWLGEASLTGPALTEESHAAAATLLLNHRFSNFPETTAAVLGDQIAGALSGTALFVRGGVGYKWTDQSFPTGSVSDGGTMYVIGGGITQETINGFFIRLEIETLTKIGSDTVIDANHTPISFSIAKRF